MNYKLNLDKIFQFVCAKDNNTNVEREVTEAYGYPEDEMGSFSLINKIIRETKDPVYSLKYDLIKTMLLSLFKREHFEECEGSTLIIETLKKYKMIETDEK